MATILVSTVLSVYADPGPPGDVFDLVFATMVVVAFTLFRFLWFHFGDFHHPWRLRYGRSFVRTALFWLLLVWHFWDEMWPRVVEMNLEASLVVLYIVGAFILLVHSVTQKPEPTREQHLQLLREHERRYDARKGNPQTPDVVRTLTVIEGSEEKRVAVS